MMNRIFSLSSVLALGVAFVACASQNDPGQSKQQVSASPDPQVMQVCGSPASSVCSDAQIFAISMTSDAGEVALAKSVRDRLTTTEARNFADKMIADHSKMLSDAKDLAAKLGITPVENGISKKLADEANMEIAAMAKKSGKELDTSYIDHEVVDHTMDLGLGDHLLIPSAKSPELKSSLLEDRAKIAEHFTLSVDVQAAIEGTCGGTGTPGSTDDTSE